MAAGKRGRALLDRAALLDRLPPIVPPADDDKDDRLFDQASLARVLLVVAEVTQESEYALCRSVATHLLGSIPEPDDSEF